jgi:hypothetical protein
MMTTVIVRPLPGAPLLVRIAAWLRGLFAIRFMMRLVGVECVVLEGRVYALRARPLRVMRELMPAIVRSSQRFASLQIDEALFDDIIKVVALGLNVQMRTVERLSVPLWDLALVVDRIARVNGLQVSDDYADMGKVAAALMASIGTASMPTSSAPPDGPGITSTNT